MSQINVYKRNKVCHYINVCEVGGTPRFVSESRISGKMQGSRHQEGQLIGFSST